MASNSVPYLEKTLAVKATELLAVASGVDGLDAHGQRQTPTDRGGVRGGDVERDVSVWLG